jgi:hypothetical protein
MKITPFRMLILMALGAFFLSGCSFVNIQNVSDINATVQVRVPDNATAYTRQISSFQIAEIFSSQGGPYTVTMLPDEQYRQLLSRLQADISQKLFSEGANLTSQQVAQLVENLNSLDRILEDLAAPMPSCSGHLPDFETVVVTISYDTEANNWFLGCG